VPDTLLAAGTVFRLAADGFDFPDVMQTRVSTTLNGISLTTTLQYFSSSVGTSGPGPDYPNIAQTSAFAVLGPVSFTYVTAVPEASPALLLGVVSIGGAAVAVGRRAIRWWA
jgi:hypothetical protein